MTPIYFTPRSVRPTIYIRQHGVTLILVLIILVVVSLLGVGGAQIALMSERGARNDRDQQLAWQAAEEGLIDAENDLSKSTSKRRASLDGKSLVDFPATGCGTADNSRGLCAAVSAGKPNWLLVDFESTSTTPPFTVFGTFTTNANFASGANGVQPVQPPRYVIEPILAQTGDKSTPDQEVVYRVTAIGFGPRKEIQSVVQMLYRI